MVNKENKSRTGIVYSLVLYIFSGLMVVLGALVFFLLLGAARAVIGYDMFFQFAGLEELAPAILRPMQAGIINMAILILVFMVATAGLLFTVGRLVAQQAKLSERVGALEKTIETFKTEP